MNKKYTKKQIAEAIAYWEKKLREDSSKKINEWDDTHLPRGRVAHHETGKPKRYWVAVDEFSDNLNNYSFFVDSSLSRRPVANNTQPPFTSQDFAKAADVAKRAAAKWPGWYVFIGVDSSSRGMKTQKNHLRSAVVDIWSPKLKFWEKGAVCEAQEAACRMRTRKQITEAIAYWQKQLNEAKDPSSYKSFDDLKKTLDAELAKMASASRPDLEQVKYIYDNYDEDGRFKYDLRDCDNYNFGWKLKLPSGGRLNDKVSSFYDACVSLVQGNEPDTPMEFEDSFVWYPLNALFLAAIEQDQKKAGSIIAQYLSDSEMQQWFDDDVVVDTDEEDGKTVEYYKYGIRLDWKEGLKILREYAKKFYDVWAKNFWRLDYRQFTVHYTAWHMDKYFTKVEAADEDEARRKFLDSHEDEYDMKDFEITSIKED